ncbi:hypothetical protein KAR91_61985 [Candidatus Pacearchaeota archaeon]|nr:hypothetical protein [Candidatus Pacearchaeota archaeon]
MKSLYSLCRDYVWDVLIAMNIPGYAYKSSARLAAIHGQISLILGCDPLEGYLEWALGSLHKSSGLPQRQPNREDWETVAHKCGKRLKDNLLEAYSMVV